MRRRRYKGGPMVGIGPCKQDGGQGTGRPTTDRTEEMMMLPRPSKAVPVSELAQGESKKNELLFKGYPHHSYVQDPYTGNTGVVYPGDSTIYAPKVRGELHEEPEVLNRRYGVTPAQAAACCYGVLFGWDTSRANPMAYNAAGEYMGV